MIVEADKLKRAVEALSESAADTRKELTGEAFDMDLLQQDGPAQPRDEEEANEVDDAPVVKFIQKVLIDAAYVDARLGALAQDEDLSRFIL